MSECNNCPNLEIVRKQLKQYIINQPPVPDCEINYELGYMYDPLYEIKDWYCNQYDIGNKYYYFRLLNNVENMVDNDCIDFNIFCRGYIHDPWNVNKYIDLRGKPLIRPGCSLRNLRMFYDYKECCLNKDWKSFVDKYKNRLDFYIRLRPIKNIENSIKIDDDILTKQIRNYYQLDVMHELLQRPRRKIIKDETITCNCGFNIYNGFSFNIYKSIDGSSYDYCYGICADPMRPFNYEIDVVRDQTVNRFRNIYENQPIDAKYCFELYICLLRQDNSKIGLSDIPDGFRLSKF